MAVSELVILVPGPPGHWRRTLGSGFRRYTDKRTAQYEAFVAARAVVAMRAQGWTAPSRNVPLELTVDATYQRPKAKYRRKDPDGSYPKTTVPDLDNVVKAVSDALTQAGAWEDDAQVSRLVAAKRVASIVDRKDKSCTLPGVIVRVRVMDSAEAR